VLSVNAATVALDAAEATLPALRGTTLFADLNTTAPELKRELAALLRRTGAPFADVALLGPVPQRGLGVPALASGPGAQAFAELFGPFGMPVTVVSDDAGDAAALKLVRSVFVKGVSAAVVESVQAAEALGRREWIVGEI
jgi:3-hydroxyisobutyrate dehydrogenase-like beta-hydroxyacid dehydrogenase